MSTISAQLRNFKEPTKEQLTQLYFALPPDVHVGSQGVKAVKEELETMEINAVLSLGVQGEEDSYVSTTSELDLDTDTSGSSGHGWRWLL